MTAGIPASSRRAASFLVSPALGLMIWTLILFGLTMFVLSQVALPAHRGGAREACERDPREHRRGRAAASRGRRAARSEYRERLKEAREQADDIVARARRSAEAAEAEAAAVGHEKREELVAAARRDIELETRRSLERIRKEVADLTVLATEKVTRKTLDSRGPPAPDRGGAEGGGLLRPVPAEQRRRQQADGGDRSRIRRGALRGGQGQGQARRDPRAARARSRTRSPRTATCRCSCSARTSPRPRSATGIAARLGRGAGAHELPRAAGREAPDAGHLPDSAAASTSCGRRRSASSRSG